MNDDEYDISYLYQDIIDSSEKILNSYDDDDDPAMIDLEKKKTSIIRTLLDTLEENKVKEDQGKFKPLLQNNKGGMTRLYETPIVDMSGSMQGKYTSTEEYLESKYGKNYELLAKIQYTKTSPADAVYNRVSPTVAKTSDDTAFGLDMIEALSYEDLCELIDVDVDPESSAGTFLKKLPKAYTAIIYDILSIPHPKGVYYDPATYASKDQFYSVTDDYSNDELEELSFEFSGDEDTEHVNVLVDTVFNNLNSIFTKASKWGSIISDFDY